MKWNDKCNNLLNISFQLMKLLIHGGAEVNLSD